MKFEVKVTQSGRDQMAAVTTRLKDLKPAYLRGAVVVLTDAQNRIQSQNDGSWPAQAVGPDGTGNPFGSLLHRTGALIRSLTLGGQDGLYQELGNGVRVGTNLRTPDGKYNIGYLMQYGTGIYGPSGQPITPKAGKFLVFEIDGKKIFARSVKGSPKRPFLFINDETAGKVRQVFANYVMQGGE